MYDDEADPYQLNNLAGSGKFRELEEEMDGKLDEWLDKLGDPFEPTSKVIEKYYKGSVNGVMPYYQNEKVSTIMDYRRKAREDGQET